MDNQFSGEEALEFSPFLKESESLPKKMRHNVVSPYKVALIALDIIVVNLAFSLGVLLSGFDFSLSYDLTQAGVLFIFSLVTLSFFPTYNVYNYHLIFSFKLHMKNLAKSFGWSMLSIFTAFFLYAKPHLFEEDYLIIAIFFGGTALMLISRFLWDQMLHIVKFVGIGFLTVGSIIFLSGENEPLVLTNWITFLSSFILAVVGVLVSRGFLVHVVFNKWLRRRFRRQVAVIGSDEEANKITNHIIEHNAPFWVTGIVGSKDECKLEAKVNKEWLCELNDLPHIVQKEELDEIIVTDEQIDQKLLIFLLDYCTSVGLTVWFPPKLLPIIDMKLYIDSFCGLPAIRLCSQKHSWLFNKLKHGLDALITLPFFVTLLPIFAIVGITIKINSKGPVFYRAKAIGKNGGEFTMYKFRSMRVENPNDIHKEYVTRLIKGEIKDEGKDDQVFKITKDPRITWIGNILRKCSLDELPQIINVLKGDMSIVGPRPCLPYEYEIYQDWHKKRLSVRPGITGLWQVAGRSTVTFEDMVLLDLYYIYNRSLLMDMNIIYETIFAVLEKRGAH